MEDFFAHRCLVRHCHRSLRERVGDPLNSTAPSRRAHRLECNQYKEVIALGICSHCSTALNYKRNVIWMLSLPSQPNLSLPFSSPQWVLGILYIRNNKRWKKAESLSKLEIDGRPAPIPWYTYIPLCPLGWHIWWYIRTKLVRKEN